MGLVDQAKRLFRALLVRLTFLVVGIGVLLLTVRINTGAQIVEGFFSPESPQDLAFSAARVLGPAIGLYLIYRALR